MLGLSGVCVRSEGIITVCGVCVRVLSVKCLN